MPELCGAFAEVYDDGSTGCDLPEGHDGLHYDEMHDVSWKKGKPDA